MSDKKENGQSIPPKKRVKLANTESNRYGYIEVVEDALDAVDTRSIGLYNFGMHLLQNYHEVRIAHEFLIFFVISKSF